VRSAAHMLPTAASIGTAKTSATSSQRSCVPMPLIRISPQINRGADIGRFHKIANVPASLPKSARPGAKSALAEIWNAEGKAHALKALKAFDVAYGGKFPKAVARSLTV
jgi:hypothetical protein